ncbi:hypothetical protein HanXRQr2_Chr15g0689111 [Helianthus annuus]|uniref:Uncharacterized protein n=1 Tax=Helianthus annuus TaxID=4232 RepID=A0A9K3H2Z8_HELAN|nr:hypothetical protein HanXRQr2_Chr15g0689111 [Helianthus annuus]KAJ0652199.1 hypothetical protein HanOQP8_Chr15g0569441 [Helianthus annuus]
MMPELRISHRCLMKVTLLLHSFWLSLNSQIEEKTGFEDLLPDETSEKRLFLH